MESRHTVYSFIFILVRVVVDPEPIPGTPSKWWENTLDEFRVANQSCKVGRKQRTQKKSTSLEENM